MRLRRNPLLNETLDHHIRLVFQKKDGVVFAGKHQISPDVAVVLCASFPRFNPDSSDPVQEQISGLVQALDDAGMEISRHYEIVGDERREVFLAGIRHKSSGSASNASKNGDNADQLAHRRLREAARERLSNDAENKRWLSVAQQRIHDAKQLHAERKRGPSALIS